MALVPSPTWITPTADWTEVVNRYVHFRRVKTW